MANPSALDMVDAKASLPTESQVQEDKVAGDQLDAKFAGLTVGDVATDEDSKYRYRMNHEERGYFIIINNKNFQPHTGMGTRSGTDADAASLFTDFKKLGFKVQQFNDRTAIEMMKLMVDVARADHTKCDCFGVAVLSHGDNSVLYGVDNTIDLDSFVAPIKDCKSLVGKPKIFIFQACRGNQLMEGVEVFDAIGSKDDSPQRIPLEADFLYAYSTVPGYFSWRNSSRGSWFVQGLHKMLYHYANKMDKIDFLKLLTRVNYEVAYDFESNASQQHMNKKKQVPSIVSMLTKDLYFTTKQ